MQHLAGAESNIAILIGYGGLKPILQDSELMSPGVHRIPQSAGT